MPLSERDINVPRAQSATQRVSTPASTKSSPNIRSKLPVPRATTPSLKSSSMTSKPSTPVGARRDNATMRGSLSDPITHSRGCHGNSVISPSAKKSLNKPLPPRPISKIFTTPSSLPTMTYATKNTVNLKTKANIDDTPSPSPPALQPSSLPVTIRSNSTDSDDGPWNNLKAGTPSSKGSDVNDSISTISDASIASAHDFLGESTSTGDLHYQYQAHETPSLTPSPVRVGSAEDEMSKIQQYSCISNRGAEKMSIRRKSVPRGKTALKINKDVTVRVDGALESMEKTIHEANVRMEELCNVRDSRPHSPSPASFSQPRSGSIASVLRASSAKVNTASRIPIPENQPIKPTLVAVKDWHAQDLKCPQSKGPFYGTRRLDAPNDLHVLDHGVKGHHSVDHGPSVANRLYTRPKPVKSSMHGADISASLFHGDQGSTGDIVSESYDTETPSSSANTDTDLTSVSCFDPVEDVSTQSDSIASNNESGKVRREIPSYYLHGETSTADARFPPPTRPFAVPLTTIPSESVLSTDMTYSDADEGRSKTLLFLEGAHGGASSCEEDDSTLISKFWPNQQRPQRQDTTSLFQNAATAEKYLAVEDQGSVVPLSDDEALIVSPDAVDYEKPHSIQVDEVTNQSGQERLPNSQHANSVRLVSTSRQSIDFPSTVSSNVARGSASESADPPPSFARKLSVFARNKSKQSGSNSQRIPQSSARTSTRFEPLAKLGVRNKKEAQSTSKKGSAESVSKIHGTGLEALPEVMKAKSAGWQESGTRSRGRSFLTRFNDLIAGNRDKCTDAVATPLVHHNTKSSTSSHKRVSPGRKDLESRSTSNLPKMPSLSPGIHSNLYQETALLNNEDGSDPNEQLAIKSDIEHSSSKSLSDQLVRKARMETDPLEKERLLTFAKVLNDSLIANREAHISAETAKQAAHNAQLSLEMTQRGVALLQKLANHYINSTASPNKH